MSSKALKRWFCAIARYMFICTQRSMKSEACQLVAPENSGHVQSQGFSLHCFKGCFGQPRDLKPPPPLPYLALD